MNKQSFNLIDDPWIKVIDQDSQEHLVSLKDIFKNARNYQSLSGEMRAQDLAILRLLLAILTTVYTRFDADGQVYEWLEIDPNTWQAEKINDDDLDYVNDGLLETWHELYQQGYFTNKLFEYLNKYHDCFDLFGDQPFYQVTTATYDHLSKKSVASNKGTVSIRQMNRLISESNNTPAIFAGKAESYKDQISLPEFARWLISYQNFTGTTDKTKLKDVNKYSASAGWLYNIDPVFVDGEDLFDTLMLNLFLDYDENDSKELIQRPVWEFNNAQEYIETISSTENYIPQNIAELYTNWSRMIHVEWDAGTPTIFTTGLPKVDGDDIEYKVEPMATWRKDKKSGKTYLGKKSLASMDRQMWRNFGSYVDTAPQEPGIMAWLKDLKENNYLPEDKMINLATANLISDGNATSQSPAAEIADNMQIKADILFDSPEDKKQTWVTNIEIAVDFTQHAVQNYWKFVNDLARLRKIKDTAFASRYSAELYDQLNEPFKNWLAGLTKSEPGPQVNKWKQELYGMVMQQAETTFKSATVKDFVGDKDGNIFIAYNYFRFRINKQFQGVFRK